MSAKLSNLKHKDPKANLIILKICFGEKNISYKDISYVSGAGYIVLYFHDFFFHMEVDFDSYTGNLELLLYEDINSSTKRKHTYNIIYNYSENKYVFMMKNKHDEYTVTYLSDEDFLAKLPTKEMKTWFVKYINMF